MGLGEATILTPDFSIGICDRLAGGYVEHLEIKRQVYTGLVLGNVRADVLASDIVRAFGNLGGENTRAIAGKERRLSGGKVVILGGQVRDVQGRHVTSYTEKLELQLRYIE